MCCVHTNKIYIYMQYIYMEYQTLTQSLGMIINSAVQ